MSATFFQNSLTILRPQKLYSIPIATNAVKFSHLSKSTSHQSVLRFVSLQRDSSRWQIPVISSGEGIDGSPQRKVPGELSLDTFLSFAEVVLIVPPSIYSIGCAVGLLVPDAVKPFHFNLGSKVFVCQFVLLVCAVVVGALIRKRQWGRICRESENGAGVDLLARIEKVEEDLRSSATIVRVLSRQLEKLGIRFRVTRKALKEPITEAAVLAQKNSEATRALALQEDILEKELGEIQKVLLAMQEQQQKQLELILAIGKAARLFEGKQGATVVSGHGKNGSNSIPERRVKNWNPKQEDTTEPIMTEPTV